MANSAGESMKGWPNIVNRNCIVAEVTGALDGLANGTSWALHAVRPGCTCGTMCLCSGTTSSLNSERNALFHQSALHP